VQLRLREASDEVLSDRSRRPVSQAPPGLPFDRRRPELSKGSGTYAR